MPFKDENKRREWERAYRAKKKKPTHPPEQQQPEQLPVYEYQTIGDILNVIGRQLRALERDRDIDSVSRANAVARLANVAGRLIENKDIYDELEKIKKIMEGDG